MNVTAGELLCLNSVLGGEKIIGVLLPSPPLGDRGEYVKEVLNGLVKKGLLDEKHNFLPLGKEVIRVLKEYNRAETKIAINRTRIGLASKKAAAMLTIEGEGYDLQLQTKQVIIRALMEAYPYLKGAQQEKKINEASYLPWEEWEKTAARIKQEDMIVVTVSKGNQLEEQKIYYRDGEGLYCYMTGSQSLYKKGARDIRVELLRLLDLQVGEEEGAV